MDLIKKILSESNEASCMRLMALISLTVGSLVAFYCLFKGCGLGDSATTIGVFVGSAFTGKVGQKYVESNSLKD